MGSGCNEGKALSIDVLCSITILFGHQIRYGAERIGNFSLVPARKSRALEDI